MCVCVCVCVFVCACVCVGEVVGELISVPCLCCGHFKVSGRKFGKEQVVVQFYLHVCTVLSSCVNIV